MTQPIPESTNSVEPQPGLSPELAAYVASMIALAESFDLQWQSIWRLLDINDLANSAAEWLDVLTQLVRAQRFDSARIAQAYLAGLVDDPPTIGIINDLPLEQVSNSMGATVFNRVGPLPFRARRLNQTPSQVTEEAFRSGRAAARRMVLGGGRSYVENANNVDPRVVRWMRVTDGDPCWFCAMLASRGPVYVTEETALYRGPEGNGARYHDDCQCQAVPIVVGAPVPDVPLNEEARRLWLSSTGGLSGRQARNAFRRAWELRSRQLQ